MRSSPDTLAALILRAQQHDADAYERIYERYVDQLYRYLYVRCNSVTLAEDTLSELWLRVVQHLPNFRIPEQYVEQSFAAWLYRIAHNLLVNALQGEKHQSVSLPDHLPAPDDELDARLIGRDEQRSLEQAFAQLTPDQQEVILLRFREGYTSVEVARITGRTESAVKALQHRALGAMARAMGVVRKQASLP